MITITNKIMALSHLLHIHLFDVVNLLDEILINLKLHNNPQKTKVS